MLPGHGVLYSYPPRREPFQPPACPLSLVTEPPNPESSSVREGSHDANAFTLELPSNCLRTRRDILNWVAPKILRPRIYHRSAISARFPLRCRSNRATATIGRFARCYRAYRLAGDNR